MPKLSSKNLDKASKSAANTTPNNKKLSEENSTGKKLVQARLPFKLISSATASPAAAVASKEQEDDRAATSRQKPADAAQERRKRKLSYSDDEALEPVVVLEYDDDSAPLSFSSDTKENSDATIYKKPKLATTTTAGEADEELAFILDESQEDATDEAAFLEKNKTKQQEQLATPVATKAAAARRSSGRGKATTAITKTSSSGGSGKKKAAQEPKMKIKLPLTGKQKRRKSTQKMSEKATTEASNADSSEDSDVIACELNPQKRQKVEEEKKEVEEQKLLKAAKLQKTTVANAAKKPEEKNNKAEEKDADAKKLKPTGSIKAQQKTDEQSAECDVSIVITSDTDGEAAAKATPTNKKVKKTSAKKAATTKGGSKKLKNGKGDKDGAKNVSESNAKSLFKLVKPENSKTPKSKENESTKATPEAKQAKADQDGPKADSQTNDKSPTPTPEQAHIAAVNLKKADSDYKTTAAAAKPGKDEKAESKKEESETNSKSPFKVGINHDESNKKADNSKEADSASKKPIAKYKPDKTDKEEPQVKMGESIEIDDSELSASSEEDVSILEDTTAGDTTLNDSKALNTPTINKDNSQLRKGLSAKQQRHMEERRQAREEKKQRHEQQKKQREEQRQREKEEREEQKQREKEERENAKKREREEKEEQRRKEREEKEEVKRKEREEKERKRQAEVDAKNEEKRKRNEAKEEEVRKREDERKRKEQEKEDAEIKKKKAAEAFSKFFVPKKTRSALAATGEEAQDAHDVIVVGCNERFKPFQVKGDMKLAPLHRRDGLRKCDKEKLDSFLKAMEPDQQQQQQQKNYLQELRSGKVVPRKWQRPTLDSKESDDIVFIDNALETASQGIVEEIKGPVPRLRAKLFQFKENQRPPYYGTWRKKNSVITARRPFAQDKTTFDYDVDSDLDWEEEEPGESLHGSDDEKEKESEDDDYEVDNEWFVPHGHLSEEELQDEDEGSAGAGEEGDTTREAQKAKLKLLQQEFAQEMKKVTQKLKPFLMGCVWLDSEGIKPDSCVSIIWNNLNRLAAEGVSEPLIKEPPECSEQQSPSTQGAAGSDKPKRLVLTDEMFKDLIQLVHGNRHSKNFLIREFIAHVEQTEDSIKNGDVIGPLKSAVREKIDKMALWQIFETTSKSGKHKKKNKKKLCWYVADDIRKQYGLEDLQLHNSWSYKLAPKFLDAEPDIVEAAADDNKEVVELDNDSTDAASLASEMSTPKSHKKMKLQHESIKKFTKVLKATDHSAEQRQKRLEVNSNSKEKSSSPAAVAEKPVVKKRVQLISTPFVKAVPEAGKNTLISKFLQTSTEAKKQKTGVTDNAKRSSGRTNVVVID